MPQLGKAIECLFAMDDAVWARHASGWSVWTRMATLPLLLLALWEPRLDRLVGASGPGRRDGLDLVEPATFSQAAYDPHLARQGDLRRKSVAQPRGNSGAGAPSDDGPFAQRRRGPRRGSRCRRGPNQRDLAHGDRRTLLIYGGKLWFLDRMVWLYEDMKGADSRYRRWLY